MTDNNGLYGKLCYMHRQLARENAKLFSEFGLTPVQMHVLAYSHMRSKSGERVCQKDIERVVNLRPSSVSTLISNLENGGFIVRTAGDDARAKYITLTEKGKYICIKNKLFIESCDNAIENALAEGERAEFVRLLDKIIDSIKGK